MNVEFGIVAKQADSKDPAALFLDTAIVFSIRKSRSFLMLLFGKCILEESQRTALLLAPEKPGTPVEINRAQ